MIKTFYDKYINKTCNLMIITNNSFMSKFIKIYDKFMKLENKICGFDMEFNNSKARGHYIALIQLGLYINNELHIIILDTETVPEMLPYVTELFTNESIVKIGHGTDSLDVPATIRMIGEENAIRFINRLYDTRFLCEYVHTLTGESKCNLYAGYSQFDVIDEEQTNYLEAVESKLGKFWMKTSHITALPDNLIIYAMYDVVYLMKFLANIKKRIEDLELDYTLGVQATRWMFLIRLKLITITKSDDYNTYYFDNIPLITHFQENFDSYVEQTSLKYTIILSNSLFKKHLVPLLQTLFYAKMSKVNVINKSKKHILNQSDINKLDVLVENINKILTPYPSIIHLLNDYVMYID